MFFDPSVDWAASDVPRSGILGDQIKALVNFRSLKLSSVAIRVPVFYYCDDIGTVNDMKEQRQYLRNVILGHDRV